MEKDREIKIEGRIGYHAEKIAVIFSLSELAQQLSDEDWDIIKEIKWQHKRMEKKNPAEHKFICQRCGKKVFYDKEWKVCDSCENKEQLKPEKKKIERLGDWEWMPLTGNLDTDKRLIDEINKIIRKQREIIDYIQGE